MVAEGDQQDIAFEEEGDKDLVDIDPAEVEDIVLEEVVDIVLEEVEDIVLEEEVLENEVDYDLKV